MRFARERFQDTIDEAMPLVTAHYDEIAHFKDIPLDPDHVMYAALEDAGVLRVFTARTDEDQLIGYAVFFVRPNIHYKTSLQAAQDVIFIHPNHRGTGGKFILWCDEELRKEGVQAVYHHVKAAHNFGPMLERFGYQLIDLIYGRRL